MKLSFSKKITGMTVLTVLIISGTVFGLTTNFVSKGFDTQLQQEADRLAQTVQTTLDDLKARVYQVGYMMASRPDVASAIEKKNTAFLQGLCRELMKNNKLGFITVADRDGKVVARGHSDKVGDDVGNQVNVKKALSGEPSVGIEEGTVVKFSLRAGYPVKVNGKIIGSVTPGIDLSSNNGFVDEMKEKLGVECTIFHQETRVSTTLLKDGKRATETKMDNPKVVETVLNKGQKFFGKNVILGKEYNTVYWPIVCADGKIGGMVFIGKDRATFVKTYRDILWSIVLSVLFVGGRWSSQDIGLSARLSGQC